MEKMTAAEKRARKEHAISLLRGWITPGTTIYTVLHTVAKSGMSRTLTAFIIREDAIDAGPQPLKITAQLWQAGLGTRTEDLTLRVESGGMDAGAAVVHHLACLLFPDDAEARRSIRQEWL